MKNAPLQHAAELALFSGLQGLVRVVPHRAVRGLGRALGTLAYRVMPARRQVALRNLELALPELDKTERRRIALGAFRQMTSHAAELLSWSRFDQAAMCRQWSLEGWQHLNRATADGASVFLMTAHFGCWEILSQAIALYAPPVAALVRPLDNPHLDRSLGAVRTRFGLTQIGKHRAARPLVRCLQQGYRLLVLIDQRVKPRDAIEVPFFGHPARATGLIARLALKQETPVLPIFVYPTAKGRYRIVVREPIPATSDAENPILDLTTRYLAAVETEIRRQPELWLWMHDRWKMP